MVKIEANRGAIPITDDGEDSLYAPINLNDLSVMDYKSIAEQK